MLPSRDDEFVDGAHRDGSLGARTLIDRTGATTDHAGATTDQTGSAGGHVGSAADHAGSAADHAGSAADPAGSTTDHAGSGRRIGDGDSSPAGRPRRRSVVTEQLHVRNYDGRHAHEIDVTFLDGDEPVRRKQYRIDPDRARSELAVVPAGEYELRVSVDEDRTASHQCLLGFTPARTAVIEVGNGVLSVTDGLPP